MFIDKRKMPILEKRSPTCRRIGLKTVLMLSREDRLFLAPRILEEAGRKGFAARFAKAAIEEMPEGDHRRFEMARNFGLEKEMKLNAPAMVLRILVKGIEPDIKAAKEIAEKCEIDEAALKEIAKKAVALRLGSFSPYLRVREEFRAAGRIILEFGLGQGEHMEAAMIGFEIRMEKKDFSGAATVAREYRFEDRLKQAVKELVKDQLRIGSVKSAKHVAEEFGQLDMLDERFLAQCRLELFEAKVKEWIPGGNPECELFDVLRQAVQAGVGEEYELAKRMFFILKEKGHLSETLARMAGLDKEIFKFRRQKVLDALGSDDPIEKLSGVSWERELDRDRDIQDAVQKAINRNMKQGDYGVAAEIAFAFGRIKILEGIEEACKELGILLRYEKLGLQGEVFYSM